MAQYRKKIQIFLSVRTAPQPCFSTNNMCTLNCGCHCAQAMIIPVKVFLLYIKLSALTDTYFNYGKQILYHHLSAPKNQTCVSLDCAILDYLILKLVV